MRGIELWRVFLFGGLCFKKKYIIYSGYVRPFPKNENFRNFYIPVC